MQITTSQKGIGSSQHSPIVTKWKPTKIIAMRNYTLTMDPRFSIRFLRRCQKESRLQPPSTNIAGGWQDSRVCLLEPKDHMLEGSLQNKH